MKVGENLSGKNTLPATIPLDSFAQPPADGVPVAQYYMTHTDTHTHREVMGRVS